MIRYSLRCAAGHRFESWFADADTYDRLRARGLVSCEVCGHDDVSKSLMAPTVAGAREAPATPPTPAPPQARDGASLAHALAEMRARLEASSTYVGGRFADEARAMHEGRKAEAPIWGEATPTEARALREDGIPALLLPFGPREKQN